MTQTYALLLRGINVSGRRKVPMAELRTCLEELGHRHVRTYLQSGNAVFTTDSTASEEALATAIEDAIEARFGFRVDCLVRDGAYLAAVAEACPFPAETLEGKQLHAIYLSGAADPERFAGIDREAYLPEDFALGDRVLYLHVPGGLGTSRLADAISRPSTARGMVATARNWNTVRKLVEMTHED
ncbi:MULTISPECIES: DUF1697 domain-containing protein [unclassified Streptomyces]|uniref:DUF1697 domain-containing protein n=1 Tax=unclassified Streptomyces TaxID=2593676 RepID=UPI0016602464|nr:MULTISPECIES: DUF1697 domain-containing protein [unclassified Streptomyces]MBD0709534.1 hypothetical protein [Streptomyces sp. CBMA291]MBD0718213.1 hypothetical protein [Streptomyces sp. CBMA370]